jgi:hypothetical protein
LLLSLENLAAVKGDEAEKTRTNLSAIREQLDRDVQRSADPLEIRDWHERFERLKNAPWKAPKQGWSKVVAPVQTLPVVVPERAEADASRGST